MKAPVRAHRQLGYVLDELTIARAKMEQDEDWRHHITDALDLLETFALNLEGDENVV